MIFGNRILTPRLTLRKVEEDDLGLLVAWSRSGTAYGPYLTPECLDPVEGRRYIRSGGYWTDNNRVFLIEQKDSEPIGTIHYWLRPECRFCAVMALKIAEPEARNAGYGTEAQKYLIIWLFERMKLSRVEMYTDINNSPQQRCLAKLGFELVESLQYDDHQVRRLGHLYRLDHAGYRQTSVYHYHYEATCRPACG